MQSSSRKPKRRLEYIAEDEPLNPFSKGKPRNLLPKCGEKKMRVTNNALSQLYETLRAPPAEIKRY